MQAAAARARAVLRAVLRTSDPPWLRLGRRGSLAFLAAGCALIAAWQLAVIANVEQLDLSYRVSRSLNGFYGRRAQNYFYFLYYTGAFPVATAAPSSSLVWNRAAARERLRSDPLLTNELDVFVRTGDLAKIFLLYPSAWLSGTPRRATLAPLNRALGVSSLLALFVSLCLLERRLLASALVIALGSNPYQHAMLYASNDVFGYPIPVASWLLALHAPVFLGRWRGPGTFALAAFSGCLLASVREVRTEPALVLLPVAASYLLARTGWPRRILLVLTLALAFAGSARLWSRYWDGKFEESLGFVTRAGGAAYEGPRNRHHTFWHPVWCGLGDFDERYGYAWDDRVAFRYGIPEVNRRFGTGYELSSNDYYLRDYHTPARSHRVRPETLPEYEAVLRDKVLGDIASDPLWYAGILLRRAARVLSQTTPVRLDFVDVPFSGWLVLPAVASLLALRRWRQLLLLGFYLPTSLTALLIYSGWGIPWGSSYHLVLFALGVCWVAHGIAYARRAAQSE